MPATDQASYVLGVICGLLLLALFTVALALAIALVNLAALAFAAAYGLAVASRNPANA